MRKGVLIAVVAVFLLIVIFSCGGDDYCDHYVPSDEWEITKDVTCEENGRRVGECEYCGEEIEEIIYATGHIVYNWKTDLKATCTTDGSRSGFCEICEKKVTEVIYAAHSWGNWITVTPSTCTVAGTEKRICSECNSTEISTLSLLAHEYGEWVVEKEATCEHDGSKYQQCSGCGIKQEQTLYATGHNYEYGECTNCGGFKYSEGLSFAPSTLTDGYVLAGIGTCTDKNIVVPQKYMDKFVTEVASSAFNGNTNITSIILPDSITQIGDRAFEGCTSLSKAVIGDSVETVGEYAFSDCSSVSEVDLGSKLIILGTGAFMNCQKLSAITFPDTMQTLSLYTFSGCERLCEVVIPEGVVVIGDGCFSYNTSLTSVTIPKTVVDIGASAFIGCTSLSKVYIFDIAAWCSILLGDIEANPIYYAKSLYLISEDENQITPVSSLVVPDTVLRINNYVFANCQSLNSVTIPSTLREIGSGAFSECTNITAVNVQNLEMWLSLSFGNDGSSPMAYAQSLLVNGSTLSGDIVIPDGIEKIHAGTFRGSEITSISIPSSVKEIGADAFYGCSSLTSLTISDIDSWCRMSFANKAANPLSVVGLLYDDGVLVLDVEIPSDMTFVGQYLFAGCTSIQSVIIPEGVAEIMAGAFDGCDSLQTIKIPSTVARIGSDAFNLCTALVSVDVASLESWCAVEFQNQSANPLYYADKLLVNGASPDGDIDLSSFGNLTEIPYGMFKGSAITSVAIPSSVTKINAYAFANCASLESVQIGAGVKEIGFDAFLGCTSLSYVGIDNIASWCEVAFENSEANPVRTANCIYFGGEKIIDLVIPDGVSKIASGAFYGCNHIITVVIPETVTNVGSDAFFGCDDMIDATLPASALPYINTSRLIRVTVTGKADIPSNAFKDSAYLQTAFVEGAGKIGYGAFSGCSALQSITLSSNVTVIGANAFEGCLSLAQITLHDGITEIGDKAFKGCVLLASVEIPSSVTKIGFGAFNGCSGIESITVPFVGGSLRTANDTYQYPFGYIFGSESYADAYLATQEYHASSTNAVESGAYHIPEALKTITLLGGNVSTGAFQNLKKVENIFISDEIIGVGSNSFDGCTSLDYQIYEGIRYIGSVSNPYLIIIGVEDKTMTSCNLFGTVRFVCDGAFKGCSSLGAVGIDSIANWCKIKFLSLTSNPLYFAKNLYVNGAFVSNLKIPDGITEIGDFAFYYASIESLEIPSSVTRIGNSAFTSCGSLTSVSMGDGVTEIGTNAFAYCGITSISLSSSLKTIGNDAFFACSSLSSVTIPNSVTKIGVRAFQGCSALRSAKLSSSLTTIGERAFSGTGLSQIIIPKRVSSIGDYAFSCTLIFCESSYQPNGWGSRWNSNTGKIYWYSDDGGPLTTKDYWCYDRSGNIYIWER